MIKDLIKLAEQLDRMGLHKEADRVDLILKKALKKDPFSKKVIIEDRKDLESYPLIKDYVDFLDQHGFRECAELYNQHIKDGYDDFVKPLFDLLNGVTSTSDIFEAMILFTVLSSSKNISAYGVGTRLLKLHKDLPFYSDAKIYEMLGAIDSSDDQKILETYISSEFVGRDKRLALALISGDLKVYFRGSKCEIYSKDALTTYYFHGTGDKAGTFDVGYDL